MITTLKDAKKQDKLDQFIKEHEKDAPGDDARLNDALKSMTLEKSSKVPGTSRPDSSGS